MFTFARPTNWNDLPHINETAVLSESDEACLGELKEVLLKHEKAARFGVALLHKHFQLTDGEVLLEHCDEKARSLLTTPVRFEEIKEKAYRPTVWRFDGANNHGCSYCPTGKDGDHYGYKEPC